MSDAQSGEEITPGYEPDELVPCPLCGFTLERIATNLWSCSPCKGLWTASELALAYVQQSENSEGTR